MNKYSASLFNYLFSSINSIVIIVNGIIMVPIYFKFMSVSTYGAWLATGNIAAMLGLIESGFASVITQKMSVAVAEKDNNKFLNLAGANIYTAVLMAFFLLLSGLSISPFVANWVNAEETIQRAITIAFIVSLISAAISLIVSLLGAFPQVWQETKTIGIIRTIVNILGVIALIIFLYLGFGVVSLALGYLTRALLNLLGQGSWILWKWRKLDLGKPAFNLSVIRVLLKDCFYPFLSKTSSVVMGNSQSFIIALFINPTLAAVYDITNKIVSISCNFVSMANGSFFALFSLTFASKNIFEINNLLKHVTTFFMVLLFTVLLYSLVFTKPIVHFWVGLDKYGGDFLLLLIVVSMLITQLKQYFNSLLYSGGLINKSSKLDVLSMVLYLLVLLIIVKKTQIYAIPIAAFVSGVIFIGLYLRLLKIQLHVDIQSIIKLSIRLLITTIPFLLLHSIFKINLMNLTYLVTYGLLFSIIYFTIIGITNKSAVRMLISKLRYEK